MEMGAVAGECVGRCESWQTEEAWSESQVLGLRWISGALLLPGRITELRAAGAQISGLGHVHKEFYCNQ